MARYLANPITSEWPSERPPSQRWKRIRLLAGIPLQYPQAAFRFRGRIGKALPSGASEKRTPGFRFELGFKLLSSCLISCSFAVSMSSENSDHLPALLRMPYAVLLSLENPRFEVLHCSPGRRWSNGPVAPEQQTGPMLSFPCPKTLLVPVGKTKTGPAPQITFPTVTCRYWQGL